MAQYLRRGTFAPNCGSINTNTSEFISQEKEEMGENVMSF